MSEFFLELLSEEIPSTRNERKWIMVKTYVKIQDGQATYSNLKRVHKGERNKVIKKYFKGNFKTIRKFWVTEDGGRLYKKRNLHWIIQYNGKINIPGDTYKWLTLWELNKFIKLGSFVGPHLRSILSLI